MDIVEVGKFIAELRKQCGMTQEQLGEKLGVTNKTVSRWETGAYLPPVEALLLISDLFSVSINELLSGKRLSNEEYRQAAEDNLKSTIENSRFSLQEKITFYKKKWLKEHIAIMCFWGVLVLAAFVFSFILDKPFLGYSAVIMLILGHGFRNNKMMTYVEKNAYGIPKISFGQF